MLLNPADMFKGEAPVTMACALQLQSSRTATTSPRTLLGWCPQNQVSGGEGNDGVYGTLTPASMQTVLDALRQHCGLKPESVLLDLGAGVGRWGAVPVRAWGSAGR